MKGNFYASRSWTQNSRKQDTQVLTLRVKDFVVPITDPGAATAFGTAVVGDFPDGNLIFLGAVAYLNFTANAAGIITTFSGNYSIGTTPTADAVLTGTDADIIATTAIGPAVASVTPVARGAMATSTLAQLDNQNGSLEMNLNVTIVDASISSSSSVRANGVLYLAYIHLGDD